MTQTVARSYSVTAAGIGKPDYSRAISSALERRGIRLTYGQTLKELGLLFTTEVQVVVLAALGYSNCIPSDIGKMVVDDGVNTAILSAYDNTSRQWRIGWLTQVAAGSVMAITAGAGGGIALAGIVNPFPQVVPPLAVGAIQHVIDVSTGNTSFVVPQSYIMFLIAASGSVTENAAVLGYIDGFLAVNLAILPSGAGPYYENYVMGITTETIDPTGASPHTIHFTITNMGDGDLEGAVALIGIMEAIGTPPLPTVKTIRCKACGREETVPQETTRWICTVCKCLNIYHDLTRMRGTR